MGWGSDTYWRALEVGGKCGLHNVCGCCSGKYIRDRSGNPHAVQLKYIRG